MPERPLPESPSQALVVTFQIPLVASLLSPGQSANARIKSCGRPNRPDYIGAKGTTVYVLFCEMQDRLRRSCPNARCAVRRIKWRRCQPRVLFPPCRLTVEDPGLSSRGIRVQIPSRRPFFFEEAPVLNPKPEFVLPYRISKKPAGGLSRQGLI